MRFHTPFHTHVQRGHVRRPGPRTRPWAPAHSRQLVGACTRCLSLPLLPSAVARSEVSIPEQHSVITPTHSSSQTPSPSCSRILELPQVPAPRMPPPSSPDGCQMPPASPAPRSWWVRGLRRPEVWLVGAGVSIGRRTVQACWITAATRSRAIRLHTWTCSTSCTPSLESARHRPLACHPKAAVPVRHCTKDPAVAERLGALGCRLVRSGQQTRGHAPHHCCSLTMSSGRERHGP